MPLFHSNFPLVKLSVMRLAVLHNDIACIMTRCVRYQSPSTITTQTALPMSPDYRELTPRAKACLSALKTGSDVIPRSELVEHCTLYLLNVCQWDHLIDHLSEQERRGWTQMDLAALLAAVCRELVNKGNDRQMSRNLWNAGECRGADYCVLFRRGWKEQALTYWRSGMGGSSHCPVSCLWIVGVNTVGAYLHCFVVRRGRHKQSTTVSSGCR